MIAAFYACRALHEAPSIRNVDKLVRQITGGRSFRWSFISPIVERLKKAAAKHDSRGGQHLGNAPATETTLKPPGLGNSPATHKEDLGTNVPRSSKTTSSHAAAETGKQNVVKLPLEAFERTATNETVRRIWVELQPHVVGVYARMTNWADKGPRKTVRELVDAGRTPDEIVSKWREVSADLGPVVRLELVQKAFLKPIMRKPGSTAIRATTAEEEAAWAREEDEA